MAQNTPDELTQGAKKAANAAKNAAKTVKTVKNIATKAASGNYVGAAIDALKNENTRKIIAISLLMSFLLTICIFIIAPLAIFETLLNALQTIRDKWIAGYYEGDSGRIVSAIKATIGLFKSDDVSSSWAATRGSEDESDEQDLEVMGSQSALAKTYARKLQAIMDKITVRQDGIKSVIEGKNGALTEHFSADFEKNYAHLYDDDDYTETVYGGARYDVQTKTVTPETAIYILSLYSQQIGESTDNITLKGLLKWLGYKAGDNPKIQFKIDPDSIVTGEIHEWKGTFLPQYLIDEGEQSGRLKEFQDDYGCSAVDFLIEVSGADLDTIEGVASEPVIVQTSRPVKAEYTHVYMVGANDASKPYWNATFERFYFPPACLVENGGCYSRVWNTELNRYLPYRVGAQAKDDSNSSSSPGAAVSAIISNIVYPVTATIHYEKTEMVDITQITYTYTVPVHIGTRSPKSLIDMAGMWEGFLPWEMQSEETSDEAA